MTLLTRPIQTFPSYFWQAQDACICRRSSPAALMSIQKPWPRNHLLRGTGTWLCLVLPCPDGKHEAVQSAIPMCRQATGRKRHLITAPDLSPSDGTPRPNHKSRLKRNIRFGLVAVAVGFILWTIVRTEWHVMKLREQGFGDVVTSSVRDHAYLPMTGAIAGAVLSIGSMLAAKSLLIRITRKTNEVRKDGGEATTHPEGGI